MSKSSLLIPRSERERENHQIFKTIFAKLAPPHIQEIKFNECMILREGLKCPFDNIDEKMCHWRSLQ